LIAKKFDWNEMKRWRIGNEIKMKKNVGKREKRMLKREREREKSKRM
jgi:hypothetical protein